MPGTTHNPVGRRRTGGARAPVRTGRREERDGRDWLVLSRRSSVAPARVWAALTRREELARWLGASSSSPSGHPQARELFLTFEGDDLLPVRYHVEHVDRGRSLGVTVLDPGAAEPWRLEVELVGDEHVGTLLTVARTVPRTEDGALWAPSWAAGCEYYLDRLVAHVERRCPEALDYDEYFVALAASYRREFPLQAPVPAV